MCCRELKKTMYLKFLDFTHMSIKHLLCNKPLAGWRKCGLAFYREDRKITKKWQFRSCGTGNTRKEQIIILGKAELIKEKTEVFSKERDSIKNEGRKNKRHEKQRKAWKKHCRKITSHLSKLKDRTQVGKKQDTSEDILGRVLWREGLGCQAQSLVLSHRKLLKNFKWK